MKMKGEEDEESSHSLHENMTMLDANDNKEQESGTFNEGDSSDDNNHRTCMQTFQSIISANLIQDETLLYLGPYKLFETIQTVRILKFLALTTLLIPSIHTIIRRFGWEHDALYSLSDFFHYEFGNVMLYSIVFALVGRVGRKRGVDRLDFVIPVFVSAVMNSAMNNIWFLKNSITYSNISCSWPWQLFLFAAILAIVISLIVYLHVRQAIRDSTLLIQLVEFTIILLIFLVPALSNTHFHFHHYYSFWILGMAFQRDEWWSRLIMAVFWGQFINGISVYGMDPIHACGTALHTSISNGCLSIISDGNYTDDDPGFLTAVEEAKEDYSGQWIEALMRQGDAMACFKKSAAEAPDFQNCTS